MCASRTEGKRLRQVGVPVQLWTSALGGNGVTLHIVEVLRQGLPRTPGWHLGASAEHYAFLAPCSPALVEAAPEIFRDGPGVDQLAFYEGGGKCESGSVFSEAHRGS